MADDDDYSQYEDVPELPDLDGLTEAEKLTVLKTYLDMLPPDLVKQAILENGMIDTSLDVLQDAANSDDPTVRADAREYIEQAQLALILPDWLDRES